MVQRAIYRKQPIADERAMAHEQSVTDERAIHK